MDSRILGGTELSCAGEASACESGRNNFLQFALALYGDFVLQSLSSLLMCSWRREGAVRWGVVGGAEAAEKTEWLTGN